MHQSAIHEYYQMMPNFIIVPTHIFGKYDTILNEGYFL